MEEEYNDRLRKLQADNEELIAHKIDSLREDNEKRLAKEKNRELMRQSKDPSELEGQKLEALRGKKKTLLLEKKKKEDDEEENHE